MLGGAAAQYQAALQQVRQLVQTGQFEETLTLCQQLLRQERLTDQDQVTVLVSKATAEYHLGLFTSFERTVMDAFRMFELPSPPDIWAEWLWLYAAVLAHRCDPGALTAYERAADAFAELGEVARADEMRLAAARLALKLDRPADAMEYAKRIEHGVLVPHARLVYAASCLALGSLDEAERQLDDVAKGAVGPLGDGDLAYLAYVRAACNLRRGHLVDAGLALCEAQKRALRIRDIELLNSIRQLRTELEDAGG